jgi:NADH-quinone oxidoreductase subunit L
MENAPLHSDTYLSILTLTAFALPLLSFILCLIISERYAWAVSILAPLLMLVSAVLSVTVLLHTDQKTFLIELNWFQLNNQEISANMIVNGVSILMLTVVAVISFLVHFYSAGYMATDLSVRKYFAMLGFFTFSMYGIVLADSLFLIFFFWELVGFASYILIGHYMHKQEAAHASKKAFIINRIGDAAFIIGLMIVWTSANTLNITTLTSTPINATWQTAASICFFIGIAGKSAQFPLFTWLPDAMVGPTPVSALIHAATMVAAGVYLMIRIFPLFTDESLVVVAVIGGFTALVAALAALAQYDIKKILAYSTISQLGIMFIALGMHAADAAFLHLITHAFFKACLFLSAGSIIHALHHSEKQSREYFDAQDIRNMGGVKSQMRVTFIAFMISAASLAGIPFTSGFLSKDFILTVLFHQRDPFGQLMYVLTLAISFITALYTIRLVWFVFFSKGNDEPHRVSESPIIMRIPMVILAALSFWFLVSPDPFSFSGWIMETDLHSHLVLLTSVVIVAAGLIAGYGIFRYTDRTSFRLLRNAFYLDYLSTKSMQNTMRAFTTVSAYTDKRIDSFLHLTAFAHVTLSHVIAWVDKYIVDGLVSLVVGAIRFAGNVFRNFTAGKIQHYIFWSLFAIIIFIIWSIN